MQTVVLSNTAQGVEVNKLMDVGQAWVCFDFEKEYGGEEGSSATIDKTRLTKH